MAKNRNGGLVVEKITGISMGVLSAAEIITLSEGELADMELGMEEDGKNLSRIDPIYHPRQGVFPDPYGEACVVCASKKQCTGHPMHIMLEHPVINPCLIKEVLYTLSCICPTCKRSIYPEKKCRTLNIQSTGHKRIKVIQKRLKKDTTCFWDDCHALLPKYEIRGEYIYYWYEDHELDMDEAEESTPSLSSSKKPTIKKKPSLNRSKKTAIKMDTNDIIKLFKCLPQEDFDNLGFNNKLPENDIYKKDDIQVRSGQTHRLSFRPEDMIFTAFPVTSKIITSQDDDTDDVISSKYRSIYKNNCKLKRHRTGQAPLENEKVYTETVHKLTQDVCILVDNTSTKTQQPHNNKEMRTLTHYIKGKKNKTAVWRNNINGKRIECNARTVISPGPFQKPYELVVSNYIADILLTESTVWSYNIKQFQKYIDDCFKKNSKGEMINKEYIPYVSRKQKKIHLKFATKGYTKPFELEEGDVVGLKLNENDWVHFNRQPSLRIESYQGLKVKLISGNKGKNFRHALCLTTAFNSDYDGSN